MESELIKICNKLDNKRHMIKNYVYLTKREANILYHYIKQESEIINNLTAKIEVLQISANVCRKEYEELLKNTKGDK